MNTKLICSFCRSSKCACLCEVIYQFIHFSCILTSNHNHVNGFLFFFVRSHGGLMGSSESAYCGVPMVLTPMYGDQFHNSAAAKARGMGWILPYEDITEETVKTAINNALSSTSRNNAKKVSYSYKNRPQTPTETAIWWVEYIAATRGGPLLQSHSEHLSAIEYYSLDVLATIAAALFIVIYPWVFIYRKCLIKSKPSQNQRKPKNE